MARPARRPSFPAQDHDHSSCLADAVARAETAFREQGMSLTPLRRRVLEEVANSHSAVGAYEVLERLAKKEGRRLAPISVYRALEALVQTGLVHRLETRNAFFACHAAHPGEASQHVILACETCGNVAEIENRDVYAALEQCAAQTGFVPSRATVEVIGNCAPCAASKL